MTEDKKELSLLLNSSTKNEVLEVHRASAVPKTTSMLETCIM